VDDKEAEEQIRFLDDRESSIAITAERAFLKKLEGGCQVPIAAYARTLGTTLRVDGLVGTIDGKRLIRSHVEGPIEKAESLGIELAGILLDKGAKEILDAIYQKSGPAISI
jgi:hydroxymethylbilane synthase